MPRVYLPFQQSRSMTNSVAQEFTVQYLGSTMIARVATGLGVVQKPLKELYVAYRKSAEGKTSQERTLTILDQGLTMTFRDGPGKTIREVTYPMSDLPFWDAVQFVAVRGSDKKWRAAFETLDPERNVDRSADKLYQPLDKKLHFLTQMSHPPLFTCVLRRKTGIKALDCHAFVCQSNEDAIELLRALYAAQEDYKPAEPTSVFNYKPFGQNKNRLFGSVTSLSMRNLAPESANNHMSQTADSRNVDTTNGGKPDVVTTSQHRSSTRQLANQQQPYMYNNRDIYQIREEDFRPVKSDSPPPQEVKGQILRGQGQGKVYGSALDVSVSPPSGSDIKPSLVYEYMHVINQLDQELERNDQPIGGLYSQAGDGQGVISGGRQLAVSAASSEWPNPGQTGQGYFPSSGEAQHSNSLPAGFSRTRKLGQGYSLLSAGGRPLGLTEGRDERGYPYRGSAESPPSPPHGRGAPLGYPDLGDTPGRPGVQGYPHEREGNYGPQGPYSQRSEGLRRSYMDNSDRDRDRVVRSLYDLRSEGVEDSPPKPFNYRGGFSRQNSPGYRPHSYMPDSPPRSQGGANFEPYDRPSSREFPDYDHAGGLRADYDSPPLNHSQFESRQGRDFESPRHSASRPVAKVPPHKISGVKVLPTIPNLASKPTNNPSSGTRPGSGFYDDHVTKTPGYYHEYEGEKRSGHKYENNWQLASQKRGQNYDYSQENSPADNAMSEKLLLSKKKDAEIASVLSSMAIEYSPSPKPAGRNNFEQSLGYFP